MNKEFDAVVIGAGIAGSAMAYSLAKRGRHVALIDKEKVPRHKACGEFLSPECYGTLKTLELDRVVDSLEPSTIVTARLHADNGGTLSIPLPGTALGISRRSLDDGLQQAARKEGVCLYVGTTVMDVSENRNGHLVTLSDGNGGAMLQARTVIAAWGRQPIRSFREQDTFSHRNAYIGVKSHYTRFDSDAAVDLYFFPGGYVGIAPIEGGRLNVAAIVSRPAYQRLGGSEALDRIVANAVDRIPILSRRLKQSCSIPGTRAAAFPVRIRSRPISWNGLPCIGDAIAAIPPFCGDGMSMALRSVELCAPLADAYLGGQCSIGEWKEAYRERIESHFTGALRWGSRLERLFARSFIAPWLLRMGAMMPGVAERLFRVTRLS